MGRALLRLSTGKGLPLSCLSVSCLFPFRVLFSCPRVHMLCLYKEPLDLLRNRVVAESCVLLDSCGRRGSLCVCDVSLMPASRNPWRHLVAEAAGCSSIACHQVPAPDGDECRIARSRDPWRPLVAAVATASLSLATRSQGQRLPPAGATGPVNERSCT